MTRQIAISDLAMNEETLAAVEAVSDKTACEACDVCGARLTRPISVRGAIVGGECAKALRGLLLLRRDAREAARSGRDDFGWAGIYERERARLPNHARVLDAI